MGYENYALIKKSTLTEIGDAIREKTGSTELIDPANFASEISDISGGGSTPVLDGGYTVNFHWTDGELVEVHSALLGNSVDAPLSYIPVTWRDSDDTIKQFPMTMNEAGKTDIFASNYSYNLLNCNSARKQTDSNTQITINPVFDNGGYLRYIETIGTNNTQYYDAWIDIGTATLEQGVEYVFSGCPAGGGSVTGSNNNAYALQLYNTEGTLNKTCVGNGTTFTLSTRVNAICRICVARKTTNVNGLKWYPMLRRSDTGENVYLPYAGD